MRARDMDLDDHEPRSLFEVVMDMTAEQWDALGLDIDADGDGTEPRLM